MLGSETSTDTASSSSLSPLSSDMLKSLSLASYDAESTEDAEMAAQIDLVLEMSATFDADGFQLPSKVTRKEVQRALESCDGDVSRAVDDVLSLVAIKTLSQQDQQSLQERQQRQQEHAKLQLSELCSGLGLDEDSSFQLLLCLDEDSEDGSEDEDVHPLQYLLELYPDYKVEVVEDVLDSHNYDVDKAADALHNLRALNHVQSYATVVNADARAAAQQRELYVNGPKVDSLGQFPELGVPSKTQQKKLMRHQRRQQKLQQAPHQRPPPKPSPPPIAYPMLPARKHTVQGKAKPAYNAWDHKAAPHDRAESGITTQLKLERLKKLLPSIDSSVIQTTFFLNGCSSDATEAALREIYNLPLIEKHLPPPTVTEEVEMAAAAADAEEELAAAKNNRPSRRGGRSENWTLVSSKHKVNAAKEKLSNRYCDVLASFRRGQHVLAVDRVRELSKARRDTERLNGSGRTISSWHTKNMSSEFLELFPTASTSRPIDLHGMIVMEALWVAREAIEYCQEHRIRRCLLICGVGHHSINGKPRILIALQLSLQRRQIASRELNGVVTVFPLRSTDSPSWL
ncbi:UBA-like [Phytophthora cactorum]|nr:UBA-like [Phytophthora cactorum]